MDLPDEIFMQWNKTQDDFQKKTTDLFDVVIKDWCLVQGHK